MTSLLKINLPSLSSTTKFRSILKVVKPINTSDGAGVKLKRSIGIHKVQDLDPFLLLDEFKSNNV